MLYGVYETRLPWGRDALLIGDMKTEKGACESLLVLHLPSFCTRRPCWFSETWKLLGTAAMLVWTRFSPAQHILCELMLWNAKLSKLFAPRASFGKRITYAVMRCIKITSCEKDRPRFCYCSGVHFIQQDENNYSKPFLFVGPFAKVNDFHPVGFCMSITVIWKLKSETRSPLLNKSSRYKTAENKRGCPQTWGCEF